MFVISTEERKRVIARVFTRSTRASSSQWESWQKCHYSTNPELTHSLEQYIRRSAMSLSPPRSCVPIVSSLLAPELFSRFQHKSELLYHILFFHEGAQANPELVNNPLLPLLRVFQSFSAFFLPFLLFPLQAEKLFMVLGFFNKLFLGTTDTNPILGSLWMSYTVYMNNKNKIRPELRNMYDTYPLTHTHTHTRARTRTRTRTHSSLCFSRLHAFLSAFADNPADRNKFLRKIPDVSFSDSNTTILEPSRA